MIHLPTINTFSIESFGFTHHSSSFGSSGFTSSAWPSANLAFYFPLTIYHPFTVTYLFIYNGATASGNIDVGVYTVDGIRISSAGSTAQSGTNALQTFDVTNFTLLNGQYYFAAAMDNATGTVFRAQPGIRQQRLGGAMQQTSAFPLPSTATFALNAQNFLPAIGVTQRSFV